MNTLQRTALFSAISYIMLHSITSVAWAKELENQLDTITLEAEQNRGATFANGYLAQDSQLGALGNKKILDTPYSIANYQQQLMEDQQASTVAEVLKNDASIRMTTNQGHLYENFQIRGFGVHGDEIALNGLYGMAPVSRVPSEMLQSVSVLKGPNALIAGMAPNGGVGGVINITPKQATEDVTKFTTSFQDESYYQQHLDFSRRFGTDKKFGIRTNFVYGEGERNMDGEEDRKRLASIAADYTGEKLQVNLDAYAIQEDRLNGSPAMVSFGNLAKVIKAPEGGTNYFDNSHSKIDGQFVGLNAKYKITDDWNVFAGGGYSNKTYDGFIFGTRLVLQDEQGNARTQTFNQHSDIENVTANIGTNFKFETGFLKHDVGLRFDYLNVRSSLHNPATSASYMTNLYQPSGNGVMAVKPSVIPNIDNDFISYTLTDQLSMLDDKIQLILGLRYQDMDISGVISKSQYSDNRLSPTYGIVLKPFGEHFSLYGNYIEGLSQGKQVTDENDVNYGQVFKPYLTKQYEVGAKYEQGSWLNTLSFFQIEKPDTLTQSFGTQTITTDDAEIKSKGIEWAFSGAIYKGLNVMGNVVYTNTEYTKAFSAKKVDLSGNDYYGTPDWTATINLDYDIPFVDGLNINTRVNYVGKQYVDSSNQLQLPDFATVDLGARYKTHLAGLDTTFMFNVNNVSNKHYWEGVFQDGFAIVGADRTYRLGVSFDF